MDGNRPPFLNSNEECSLNRSQIFPNGKNACVDGVLRVFGVRPEM
jgi:hypothetical protein